MADYSTVSLMTHEKNPEQETQKGISPVCLSRFRVAYVLWKVSQLVLCQIWSVVLDVWVSRGGRSLGTGELWKVCFLSSDVKLCRGYV